MEKKGKGSEKMGKIGRKSVALKIIIFCINIFKLFY